MTLDREMVHYTNKVDLLVAPMIAPERIVHQIYNFLRSTEKKKQKKYGVELKVYRLQYKIGNPRDWSIKEDCP